MRHTPLRQVHRLADVQCHTPRAEQLLRTQRLDRWVEVLLQHRSERLTPLEGTEYRRPESRDVMRQDNSPISVAFRDPVLRSAGLRNDTYGEAKRFFELSDRDLHYVLCHCHFGGQMSAWVAAERVRIITPAPSWPRKLGQRIRGWFD